MGRGGGEEGSEWGRERGRGAVRRVWWWRGGATYQEERGVGGGEASMRVERRCYLSASAILLSTAFFAVPALRGEAKRGQALPTTEGRGKEEHANTLSVQTLSVQTRRCAAEPGLVYRNAWGHLVRLGCDSSLTISG
jgi:hypothetical protein